MNAFKCDRCGKLFEDYSERKFEGNYRIIPNKNGGFARQLDLCKNCNDELQDWANAFKKKEEQAIKALDIIKEYQKEKQ